MNAGISSDSSPPNHSLLTPDEIRAEVARLLDLPVSDIADDDDLLDLGMDSVRLMSLVQRWQERGVSVEFADLAERPELSAWIELVTERG